MLVNTILMLVYVTKFFWWEAGYWNTMDIAHDRGMLLVHISNYIIISSKSCFTIWPLKLTLPMLYTFLKFSAGFYICWGCLVWVPSIYTSPGMYLVNHPVQLGTQVQEIKLLLSNIEDAIHDKYPCV